MSVSEVLRRESEQHWMRDVGTLMKGFLSQEGAKIKDLHLLKESADLEDALDGLEDFARKI